MKLFLMKHLLLVCSLLLWTSLAQAYDHGAWERLLSQHVVPLRGGVATAVDYAGLAARRHELRVYLDGLAAVRQEEFARWSKPERLAFLINAYNAWTVQLVLGAWPELSSIKDLGSLFRSPWKKEFIPLLGKTRSLDGIEQGLLRAPGAYDEPRIHFALNCASIGCPALRPEAYAAARLETQLADATRRFLSDRSRNRLEGGELKLSSIFKWYGDDFDVAGGLHVFLAGQGAVLGLDPVQHRALREGRLDIGFLDYDWRLNRLKRQERES